MNTVLFLIGALALAGWAAYSRFRSAGTRRVLVPVPVAARRRPRRRSR
jgi:hypothetical protein